MKKILNLIIILLLAVSCTNLTKKGKEFQKFEAYKLEAQIITNKGDINLFLYPEAAPETVANFVFLAQNGFYDNLSFHRVEAEVVQGGDPLGNGTGGTGYTIKDEFDGYLKFTTEGMLAMANAGPNTSSSQFFITKIPMTGLNGSYTIFGSLKSTDDLITVNSLTVGDRINKIVISGVKSEEFLDNFKDKVAEWSNILSK
ncbi:peptidylprolyl isomerase [Oceanivirga salmonicida]|uniref:peptidylprolyl isomerase n=1 Tax=Oceanivirga salmonicida TaxID=1769291 RepID=UPI0008362BBF|nr:peptidylprolyl isomerase [Oceanivirga salmonicida]